jgi:dCMP deaminase
MGQSSQNAVLLRASRCVLTPQQVWDLRFLRLAREVSTWSKDPSTKVGAIIVNDRHVVGQGYNGFPMGIDDTAERLNDREFKYSITVHAEINAILDAQGSVKGCTLYTWPFMPCSSCAAVIIQSGIRRVVTIEDDNERWRASFGKTKAFFKEVGVQLNFFDEKFCL